MSDQLFRWIKTSDRNPTEGDLYHVNIRLTGSGHETFPGTCNWYNNWQASDDYEVVEWLEPYTPSLNAGSLEEAAKKYANENGFKVIGEDDDEGAASHKYIVDAVIYGASLSNGALKLKEGLEKIYGLETPDTQNETQEFVNQVFGICSKTLDEFNKSK